MKNFLLICITACLFLTGLYLAIGKSLSNLVQPTPATPSQLKSNQTAKTLLAQQTQTAPEQKHTKASNDFESSNSEEAITLCSDEKVNSFPLEKLAKQLNNEYDVFDNHTLLNALKDNAVTLESKITYGLLSYAQNPEQPQPLITLFSDYPNNRYLAHQTLLACANQVCDEQTIQSALTTDRNNGASWLAYASLIDPKQNPQQTLDAIINAANTQEYNEYRQQTYYFFDETLNQLNMNNDLLFFIGTESLLAATPSPSFSTINKICSNVTQDEVGLLDACINIGERLEQSQSTLLSTAIGIALQRKAYEVRNDQSEIAFLNAKTQDFQKLLIQSTQAMQLMWQSKQRTLNYVLALKNSNEVDAARYLVEQAITLSNDPEFDPCVIEW
ncbi:hypothetical protein [Pseudoalteromonas sp. G4]|uniref:hypothetical protein n=1 Tax=Pseudoalteromonas sp. G4 TaxID=2992761 RepID=UPI00237E778F|nr:hypothetical protein [Pseudoalteromonas sp. G4]MDE3273565.1 hypothetical protein [Pseudoalteromonas sp. G4]